MGMHPEEAKIQTQFRKIRDPELKHMHAIIVQRAKDKPSHTCLQVVADIEGVVIRRRQNTSDNNENARRVKQTTAKKQQNCECQNPNPQGGKNHIKNHHPDAKTITLKNGEKIKHHHSFRFDNDDCKIFSKEQKKTLRDECCNADPKSNWKS